MNEVVSLLFCTQLGESPPDVSRENRGLALDHQHGASTLGVGRKWKRGIGESLPAQPDVVLTGVAPARRRNRSVTASGLAGTVCQLKRKSSWPPRPVVALSARKPLSMSTVVSSIENPPGSVGLGFAHDRAAGYALEAAVDS